MKKLLNEFKAFIAKGSVINLAVGVIIGAAFTAIVNSLVSDIISPLLGLLASNDLAGLILSVGGVDIKYGAFLTAVINFFLTALVLFFIIKVFNSASKAGDRLWSKDKTVPESVPATKKCPYCKSEIPADATRCAFCTSMLD